MSNIKTAVAAIKAEMKHAESGLKFYQAKVASLEHAIANLEGVDQVSISAGSAKGRKARAKSAPAKATRTGRAKASRDSSLPATGKDFWPTLLGSEPKSASEIFEAAVQALGISPDQDQAKKLAQRQANALSVLTKAGTISSTGDGRSRRYYI